MKNEIEITGFRLYRIGNSELRKKNFVPRTEKDLISEGLEGIPATVPGCVERDLAAAGLFPADVAYGDNILRCRELERTHFYYATAFDIGDGDEETILRFDGIDTAAEIFIDGELLGKTENMLIPHEFPLFGLTPGEHELLVHIIPVSVYVDDKEVPASCWALSYSLDNLCVRKAPYMFGWDIMPRAVSAGLWRPVKLCRRPATRLEDVFLRVNKMNPQCADVSVRCALRTDADDFSRFTIGVHGECDDSVFDHKTTIFGVHNDVRFNIENPKIWQPRGYGKQHLYNVTVTVYYDEKAVCSENFRTGLRTVYLDRGKTADGKAKFDFIVNGKPVFILGTNIVPADVFPAVGEYSYRPRTRVGNRYRLQRGENMGRRSVSLGRVLRSLRRIRNSCMAGLYDGVRNLSAERRVRRASEKRSDLCRQAPTQPSVRSFVGRRQRMRRHMAYVRQLRQNNRYARRIPGSERQYSHKKHSAVRGCGLRRHSQLSSLVAVPRQRIGNNKQPSARRSFMGSARPIQR